MVLVERKSTVQKENDIHRPDSIAISRTYLGVNAWDKTYLPDLHLLMDPEVLVKKVVEDMAATSETHRAGYLFLSQGGSSGLHSRVGWQTLTISPKRVSRMRLRDC